MPQQAKKNILCYSFAFFSLNRISGFAEDTRVRASKEEKLVFFLCFLLT